MSSCEGIKYTGVRQRSSGNWSAQIKHSGKAICVGTYNTAEAAAQAWDKMAIKLRGPHTFTNFPNYIYNSGEKSPKKGKSPFVSAPDSHAEAMPSSSQCSIIPQAPANNENDDDAIYGQLPDIVNLDQFENVYDTFSSINDGFQVPEKDLL